MIESENIPKSKHFWSYIRKRMLTLSLVLDSMWDVGSILSLSADCRVNGLFRRGDASTEDRCELTSEQSSLTTERTVPGLSHLVFTAAT